MGLIKSHKKNQMREMEDENMLRKSAVRQGRQIKTTKSQKHKMALTPKNRNTIEPISQFRTRSQLKGRKMKESVSMSGMPVRGFRGKSPFRKSKPKEQRKSVIRVSTISYNQTPEKPSKGSRRKLNKSIINTRIESQKEFQNDTGSKLKKQIVYTKRGQEIMDSLINTGKARIANKNNLKEIIRRKKSEAVIQKRKLKDSPYNFSRKNISHKPENYKHQKYKLRKPEPESHRRVKTNIDMHLGNPQVMSPDSEKMNDFGGFYKEKVVHERLV
jgi:hypothetical protein